MSIMPIPQVRRPIPGQPPTYQDYVRGGPEGGEPYEEDPRTREQVLERLRTLPPSPSPAPVDVPAPVGLPRPAPPGVGQQFPQGPLQEGPAGQKGPLQEGLGSAAGVGAAPPGFDAAKWADPTHQSFKYLVGRYLAQHPGDIQGASKLVPGSQTIGHDILTNIPGENPLNQYDILRDAGPGGANAPQWSPVAGFGDAPAEMAAGGGGMRGGLGLGGRGLDYGPMAEGATAVTGDLHGLIQSLLNGGLDNRFIQELLRQRTGGGL